MKTVVMTVIALFFVAMVSSGDTWLTTGSDTLQIEVTNDVITATDLSAWNNSDNYAWFYTDTATSYSLSPKYVERTMTKYRLVDIRCDTLISQYEDTLYKIDLIACDSFFVQYEDTVWGEKVIPYLTPAQLERLYELVGEDE